MGRAARAGRARRARRWRRHGAVGRSSPRRHGLRTVPGRDRLPEPHGAAAAERRLPDARAGRPHTPRRRRDRGGRGTRCGAGVDRGLVGGPAGERDLERASRSVPHRPLHQRRPAVWRSGRRRPLPSGGRTERGPRQRRSSPEDAVAARIGRPLADGVPGSPRRVGWQRRLARVGGVVRRTDDRCRRDRSRAERGGLPRGPGARARSSPKPSRAPTATRSRTWCRRWRFVPTRIGSMPWPRSCGRSWTPTTWTSSRPSAQMLPSLRASAWRSPRWRSPRSSRRWPVSSWSPKPPAARSSRSASSSRCAPPWA